MLCRDDERESLFGASWNEIFPYQSFDFLNRLGSLYVDNFVFSAFEVFNKLFLMQIVEIHPISEASVGVGMRTLLCSETSPAFSLLCVYEKKSRLGWQINFSIRISKSCLLMAQLHTMLWRQSGLSKLSWRNPLKPNLCFSDRDGRWQYWTNR